MASRSKAKGIVPVLHSDSPDFEKAFARLVDRGRTDTADVEKVVRKIIDRVREECQQRPIVGQSVPEGCGVSTPVRR